MQWWLVSKFHWLSIRRKLCCRVSRNTLSPILWILSFYTLLIQILPSQILFSSRMSIISLSSLIERHFILSKFTNTFTVSSLVRNCVSNAAQDIVHFHRSLTRHNFWFHRITIIWILFWTCGLWLWSCRDYLLLCFISLLNSFIGLSGFRNPVTHVFRLVRVLTLPGHCPSSLMVWSLRFLFLLLTIVWNLSKSLINIRLSSLLHLECAMI